MACLFLGGELLGTFTEDGIIKHIGLFAPQGAFAWQTFQPANAPVGAWLSRPGEEHERAIGQLFSRLPGAPFVLGMSQQDPAIAPPPPASRKSRQIKYIDTPRLTVTGSFADYWKTRSKNTRHNFKRQFNRLKRQGLEGHIEILSAANQMGPAIADYADLESSGWKGRRSSAVSRDGKQAAFYATILEHYAERNQACVWRHFIGDRLAASNLCIARDGTLIVLKTAYNEDLREHSPAQLMTYEAFRLLFDGGATKRIEFYGPVKDWHMRWTDDVRSMYHLNFYRWPFLKTLHGCLGKGDHP